MTEFQPLGALIDGLVNWLAHGLTGAAWWEILIATLVMTHITIASVTIFLHRSQAHRALDLHPAVMHFFHLWLWLPTGMVTKEWAAIHRKHTQTGLEHMGSAIALFVTVMWGVFSVPLSFAIAGGFMFWLFGIRIRDKHGRRASRLLCSARTLLAWAPLLLGSIAVFYLANGEHAFLATLVASLVSIGFVLAVFHAIQNPQQSFVDRILGTRLVPK